jgi:hypothetical protein
MLETLAMFSNVQPQLQPHLPRAFSLPRPIPHEVLLDREALAIVSEPCPVATSCRIISRSPVEIWLTTEKSSGSCCFRSSRL